MAQDVIQQAMKHVRAVSTKEVERQLGVIRPLEQRIAQFRNQLYPLEKDALPKLDLLLGQVERQSQQLTNLAQSGIGYPLFDLTPLTWRNEQGFPKLAIFGLDSPDFELQVGYRWDGALPREAHPALPADILRCYEDVFKKLERHARQRQRIVKLKARFNGLIPPEAKAEIAKARGALKHLSVVAEVTNWQLEEVTPPRPADPLVIGFDGYNWRLITCFDLTPLEEYLKHEFSIPVGP